MPRVRIRYFAHIAERMGIKEKELLVPEGFTLAELLLEHIPMKHPDIGQEFVRVLFKADEEGNPVLSGRYLVLVNGRSWTSLPGKMCYELREGDKISIFPPLGGG